MKKISLLILGLIIISFSTNAQSDSIKYILKLDVDINYLIKREGLSINYLGFEKAISSNTSLSLYLGYDFNSSNLIIDGFENVINIQDLKLKFDYRYYCLKTNSLQGLYISPALCYNLNVTNEENQTNYQTAISLGLGYQTIWRNFVFDIQTDKQYRYSSLKNNELKIKTSKITPFNVTFSVGYAF
ncbi:hypothetical protein FACS189437_07230 [Bacteroidia bacterium]|nr:hypothetical protein FACS189437_07230 [Bacteroidia bacterium]